MFGANGSGLPNTKPLAPEALPLRARIAIRRPEFRSQIGPAASPFESPSHPNASRTLPAGRLTGPVQVFVKIISDWSLRRDEAAALLGFEHEQLPDFNAILSGRKTLQGRDAKDRIAHLLSIYSQLSTLLGGTQQATEWLHLEQEALGGQRPFELLREGSMENLLAVRRLVEYACGYSA